jgi:tRNA-splicing ligase RtcB
VLIGGSMGTSSFVLIGTPRERGTRLCVGLPWGRTEDEPPPSDPHMGRPADHRRACRPCIIVPSPSARGVAEEAPGAYKDVTSVVDAAEQAGLARKVARLAPLICIKG